MILPPTGFTLVCKYNSKDLCKLSLCVTEVGHVGSDVPV